jgi:hypothetical protein
MTRLSAFVLLLAFASSAQASCVVKTYLISGVVVDRSGDSVPGALVGASWNEAVHPAGPSMTTTGSDGSFSLKVRFNTYTGSTSVGGDYCNGELRLIALSACAGDSRSMPLSVTIGDAQTYGDITISLWENPSYRPTQPACTDG